MWPIRMSRERTGIGSDAKLRGERRISGDALRRDTETLITKRRTWMALERTGQSITRRLLRGLRKRSDTWVWQARFRTGRAIRTESICQRCRGAALTTLFRKARRKPVFLICRTDARN